MMFKANLCFTFPQECIEEHLLAWIHPSLLCASLQMEKFNKQTKCQVLPLVSKISGAQWAEGRADLELESEKRYNTMITGGLYTMNWFTCFGSKGIMLRGSRATDELEEGLGEAS